MHRHIATTLSALDAYPPYQREEARLSFLHHIIEQSTVIGPINSSYRLHLLTQLLKNLGASAGEIALLNITGWYNVNRISNYLVPQHPIPKRRFLILTLSGARNNWVEVAMIHCTPSSLDHVFHTLIRPRYPSRDSQTAQYSHCIPLSRTTQSRRPKPQRAHVTPIREQSGPHCALYEAFELFLHLTVIDTVANLSVCSFPNPPKGWPKKTRVVSPPPTPRWNTRSPDVSTALLSDNPHVEP